MSRSGKAKYDSGAVYDGEFANDKRCGWGQQCFPDESMYEGEWEDDTMQGKAGMSEAYEATGKLSPHPSILSVSLGIIRDTVRLNEIIGQSRDCMVGLWALRSDKRLEGILIMHNAQLMISRFTKILM